MDLDEDLQNMKLSIDRLYAILKLCLLRVEVFELGDEAAVLALLKEDKEEMEMLKDCETDDILDQERFSELWDSLHSYDDRNFRLRLIGKLSRQETDTERQTVNDQQMNDLLLGMQNSNLDDLAQNKNTVAGIEEAVDAMKKGLHSLMLDMTLESFDEATSSLPEVNLDMEMIAA